MNIIAIDSSGLVASVAIANESGIVAEYTVNNKKTHSQTLLPMLNEIKEITQTDIAQIDAVAIASGPGSFTGLRIGSATAKGIALALGVPIVEVSTLEALAANVYATNGVVCPIMDARRNQVYTAAYSFVKQGTKHVMEELIAPCAVAVEEMAERLNEMGREVVFLGDAVPVYGRWLAELLSVSYSFAPMHLARQRAGCVACLGVEKYMAGQMVSAGEHSPEYLRLSQAERERMEAAKKEE